MTMRKLSVVAAVLGVAALSLYPLLVHVRLFGGSYVSDVERTLTRFGH